MAKSISITGDWADGTYTFRLGFAQLEEHDEKCKVGPLSALAALVDGSWRVPYVRETIRLGLIGGGTKPVDAVKLVRRYVDDRPMIENLPFAIAILGAAIHGEGEDDEPGKPAAATPETDPQAPGSTSPQSDETPV